MTSRELMRLDRQVLPPNSPDANIPETDLPFGDRGPALKAEGIYAESLAAVNRQLAELPGWQSGQSAMPGVEVDYLAAAS